MGWGEILRIVEGWPRERIVALTRELVGKLPDEERAAMVRDALAKSRGGDGGARVPGPDLSRLVGLLPWPEGEPIPDIDEIREERLWKKYGPW